MESQLKESFAKDLQVFLESTEDCKNSILLFPTINSYSRLKLHEVTKESFPDLASFSVGEEPERRPVICRQSVIADWTLKSMNSNPLPMPQQPQPQVTPKQKTPLKSNAGKRPEKALYVPRALRQQQEQQQKAEQEPVEQQISVPQLKTWKDEIYAVTGPVKTVPPLTDYLALESGCVTSSDLAFRRVIELADFPKEHKTSDLETSLHSGLVKMKNYYDLRWVDDHHALVIFSDEVTASKALRIEDDKIKFKPFYEATEASKSKAKTFNDLLEQDNAKVRPNTSTVMAKRLLSRALNNPSIKADPQQESALKEAQRSRRK